MRPPSHVTIHETLTAAVQLHQAGQLAEAERLYREILLADSRQADAWHLLGLIELQRDSPEAALRSIARAVEIDDRQPSFYNHLAEVYRTLGKLVEAEAACRRALELNPDFAIAHNTLGILLAQLGREDEAAAAYGRAIELQADFAQAHGNLGVLLRRLGRLDESLACLNKQVACDAASAIAHHELGLTLAALGNRPDAIEALHAAVRLDPRNAQAHMHLGSLRFAQEDTVSAIAHYREAISLDDRLAAAHLNLAIALQQGDARVEAVRHYERAIELQPDNARAYNNLGTIHRLEGRLVEAADCFDTALRLAPEFGEAHRNRALLRLLLGDYERGWSEYEWRRRLPDYQQPHFSEPDWDGQARPGKTILLVAEQGLGDAIQFARYAAMVKRRSRGRVLLRCHPNWHALLKTTPGVDEIIGLDTSHLKFDDQIPLMSLPRVFGTTLRTIPADVPYLSSDARLIDSWRERLAHVRGLKVGIAWQGSPGFAGDRYRSIPLVEFRPLASCLNVTLFSLQKGFGREQIASLDEPFPLVDLGAALDETTGAMVETAAVMKNLDLVITSDTSIAHLAGALGVSVWVALQLAPNWRWLVDRDDSPWYPTMRLFRQPKLGDWHGVFAAIARELNALAARD